MKQKTAYVLYFVKRVILFHRNKFDNFGNEIDQFISLVRYYNETSMRLPGPGLEVTQHAVSSTRGVLRIEFQSSCVIIQIIVSTYLL